MPPTDDRTTEDEEGLVNVVAALVAGAQPTELVQPCQGAFRFATQR
jgi:hypothetical protein